MKKLMESILSIDHSASDKLKAAVQKKKDAMQSIDEEKRKLSTQMENYANEHLGSLDEFETASAQESILEISAAANDEKKRLQAIYDEQERGWVDSIVAHVLYE